MPSFYKLDVVPKVVKGIPEGILIPQGFRLSVLNYKTVEEVKRDSEAWILPVLYVVPNGASAQDRMVADLVCEEQDEALREYVNGDLDMEARIELLSMLAEWYFTDGRGNRSGVKQSALVSWIMGAFKSYLDKRIAVNLANETPAKRDNLVASLLLKYKIAATRGNRLQLKKESLTIGVEGLREIAKRLDGYLNDAGNPLDSGEESVALMARIAGHIQVLSKTLEVDVLSF